MPWTTALIPSQAGRRALVTGATSGIGYEAALALAGAGAEVVIAARDAGRAEDAARAIRRAHPGAEVAFRLLDTARLASVRAFAEEWRAEARPIDILLLNAGIAAVPRREETEDGFERQFATNYLGHFALTGLLLPHLRNEAGRGWSPWRASPTGRASSPSTTCRGAVATARNRPTGRPSSRC